MTINVQSKSTSEILTSQIGYYEDGEFILDSCDHAGAIEEEKEFTGFSSLDGMQVPDDNRTDVVMVCDKENCKAWKDQDNTWRND